MADKVVSVLEKMAYTAVDLKSRLGQQPPKEFEIYILGQLDASFREQRAEALAIRARRAHLDDADSRAIVAYLDALL